LHNELAVLLADCTNGRAYVIVLCPSVCRLSVRYVCMVCIWLNGASCRKSVWKSK